MDEGRLRDALHGAARAPSTDGVLDRVHEKRRRRHTVRRVRQGMTVAALLAGLVVVSVVVLDEPVGEQEVAVRPGPGSAPRVRIVEPDRTQTADVRRLRLSPDEGYVRGPLLMSTAGPIAAAAYDREGDTYTFPPSRVVLFEPSGSVAERIDLEGEVLSLAEGEGARWALTHDKEVLGPEDPEFRVKRLGADGTVVSNAVPPGEQPVGRIAAGGGGVWVPVRDGVLRFDTVTGAYAGKVALAHASDHRAVVAAGKFHFVTDGNTQVRLDPAQRDPAGVVNELAPSIELLDATNVPSLGSSYLLGFDTTEMTFVVSDGTEVLALPEGFTASSIRGTDDLVWVDGSRHGVRAVVVLDATTQPPRILRTIRLTRLADDADVLVTSASSAVIASRGSLYRVALNG
jgi:hypothetical protein